jgi:hypothetical protein
MYLIIYYINRKGTILFLQAFQLKILIQINEWGFFCFTVSLTVSEYAVRDFSANDFHLIVSLTENK